MNKEIKKYWSSQEFQEKYQMALDIITEYLLELGNRYEEKYSTTCIRHLESRIKSLESIDNKFERKEIKKTVKNLEERINDIAGARMICFNTAQVYKIARMISDDNLYEIVKAKDYINIPKKNGYQSYHIVLNVPIKYHGKEEKVKVEIQLRTILMDAWASVDAIVSYKKKKKISKDVMNVISDYVLILNEQDKRIKKIMGNH